MSQSLVTGGAGFVGSHLVPALLEQGDDVVILDLPPRQDLHRRFPWMEEVSYVQGNLLDVDTVLKATKGADTVYHLASVVGVDKYVSDPLQVIETNVLGSKNVFEAAAANRARVLFTSTSEVFGKNPRVPWKEDDDRVVGSTRLNRWSYSTTKALCEHMLFALREARALDFTVVRYFNVYGPRQRPVFVLPAMVDRVLDGKPPQVFDNGRQTRCFTFVSDAIEGTLAAANHPKALAEVFNIGNHTETAIHELAQMVLRQCGREDLGIEFVETKQVYGATYEDLQRRVPDTQKALDMLGWRVQTDLGTGLQRTIDWFRTSKSGGSP